MFVGLADTMQMVVLPACGKTTGKKTAVCLQPGILLYFKLCNHYIELLGKF